MPQNHEQSTGGHTVSAISPENPAYPAAFSLALTGEAAGNSIVEAQRRNLDLLANENGIAAAVFVMFDAQNQMQTAALYVESPGGSALVHLPPDDVSDSSTEAILEAAIRRGADRKLNILQTLLRPGESRRARMLNDLGFQYLAELIYLTRSLEKPGIRKSLLPDGLKVETYREDLEHMFIQGLEATYEDSQDCPALTPMRSAGDAFAGHKASGVFDPEGFFVVMDRERPAAVLLTSCVVGSRSLEIVYMGVLPRGRRKGLGESLLNLAKERARSLGLSNVTLAVDSTNEPARKLYAQGGFIEETRRRAWIRVL